MQKKVEIGCIRITFTNMEAGQTLIAVSMPQRIGGCKHKIAESTTTATAIVSAMDARDTYNTLKDMQQ